MWKQLESGRVVHRFDGVIIVATLALVPVLVIETKAKSARWQVFATAANWLIWAIFAAELVFILTVAPRKVVFSRSSGKSADRPVRASPVSWRRSPAGHDPSPPG